MGEGATYDYSPYLALCGVHEVVVGGFGGGRGEVPGGAEAHERFLLGGLVAFVCEEG